MKKNLKIKPGFGLYPSKLCLFPKCNYFITDLCFCVYKKRTGILRGGYIITSVIKKRFDCKLHEKTLLKFMPPNIIVYKWWE